VQTYWLRYRGTRFPVRRGEYILGRSPYCSIVVSNALASRQHCAVRLSASGLTIVDLGSRNGTNVNGERLREERTLKPGDIIRVGSDGIEVILTDGQTPRHTHQTQSGERHDTQPRLDVGSSRPPPKVSTSYDSEESSTTAHATLDLVVALVEAYQQLPNRCDNAPTVRRAIDIVVEARLHSGAGFQDTEIQQIVHSIEALKSWFPDGSLDRWSQDTLAALGVLK
jgi:pSer/pThr/pTyr-binding forkhead associated (FHA) protein